MFFFGSGVLQGFRTDIANATPVNFGLVQEVSFDLSFTTKELYGQNQFPVAIARGTGKFTGKAKVAAISGIALAGFFFGLSVSTGQQSTAFGESGTPATSAAPTVTVANAANYVADYGVVVASTGLPLTKVASAPSTNQYSVNIATGVYTFNAAQAGTAMLISYTFNISATGEQMTITNPLLGNTPTFQANFYGTYGGKAMTFTAYNCVSSKIAYASKLEDFMIPEIDFSLFANAAGNVGQWSFADAA